MAHYKHKSIYLKPRKKNGSPWDFGTCGIDKQPRQRQAVQMQGSYREVWVKFKDFSRLFYSFQGLKN